MVNLVSAVNVWGPLFITCGVHVARVLALDAVLSPEARTLSSEQHQSGQTGPGLLSPVNPLLDKKTLIVLINARENSLKAKTKRR